MNMLKKERKKERKKETMNIRNPDVCHPPIFLSMPVNTKTIF